MLLELASRLWQGDEPIEQHHPVGYTGQLAVLAEGLAFLPSFANVTAFETSDGLVLVDTGGYVIAPQVHEQIRAWSDMPLHTAVYSHGHVDHVFGVPHFEGEDGARPARVVAHENVPRRFDRYTLTAGYNGAINARQFQLPELAFPTEFRYPDETYRSQLAWRSGGSASSCTTPRARPTITPGPGCHRAGCSAAATYSSGPPPTRATRRRPSATPASGRPHCARWPSWAPRRCCPGHGLPVVGEERVQAALTDTAALLESLVDQTLELMNQGEPLDRVLQAVRAPRRSWWTSPI